MGTNTGTIMTLANSIIGVGVLAMPFCFKQCGVILSIFMLLLSSFLSRLACHFLLKAAIMARRRNFEFLAFHTFGPPGKTIVELCVIGFLMGTCIAFFVVVGDLGPAIVAKTLNINNTASLRQSVLIGLALFVVLPLGLLRNVDSLSSICTATIGFYLCLVLKVMAEAMPHLVAGDWVEKVHLWRPAGVLQCIPIFSMALFCQTQLFEIYESLPNANLEKMNDVVRAAVNLCTAFYICVGFFGYVAFCTQNFTGNVLMNFTPTLMSDIIKMGFVLSVAVSFPLVIFPCRASLYSLLFKRASFYSLSTYNPTSSQNLTLEILNYPENSLQPMSLDTNDSLLNQNAEPGCASKLEIQMPHHETMSSHIPETRFKCVTICIISVALTVGLLIPNIELVLGLVGSTIGVLICVMFPAVAFICISTKSTRERLLAQVLVFVGVLILVLGTYATLYAANEAGNVEVIETFSAPSDHLDSVPRMTQIQVDNHEKVADADEAKSKVKLKDKVVEPKQELQVGDPAAGGQNPPKLQQGDLPKKVDNEKKSDVRQEPPVPVEPPADNIPPAVPSETAVEKKDEKKEKDIVAPVLQHNEQAGEVGNHKTIKKDGAADSPIEKKVLPDSPIEKGKVNNEQVNQDAIKKEDEELAEAEKQAESDNEKKNEELLRKLEKHQEEQKKLLQEQKQILEELKEHKKEIEQAAAKQKNDDTIPQGLPEIKNSSKIQNNDGKNQVVNKIDLVQNVASPQNENVLAKNMESGKDSIKPQSAVAQEQNRNAINVLPKSENLDSPKNFVVGSGPNNINKFERNLTFLQLQPGPLKLISQEKPKVAALDVNKVGDVETKLGNNPVLQQGQGMGNVEQKQQNQVQQQNGPVPNKIPLPLPLAVRHNTSRFYKQMNKSEIGIASQRVIKQNIQQNVAGVDEAKVMRRDILANDDNSLKSDIKQENKRTISEMANIGKAKQRDILSNVESNEKNEYDKNKSHERQKRNTLTGESPKLDTNALLVASTTNKENNKQEISNIEEDHVSENCEVSEKMNQINEEETLNMVVLAKDKHNVVNDFVGVTKEQVSLSESDKHADSPQALNLGDVSESLIGALGSASKSKVENSAVLEVNTSITNTKLQEDKAPGSVMSSKVKTQNNSETSKKSENIAINESVSTLSSIIKTPSHLSDPKLNDGEMGLLTEALGKIKDVAVAKPMTRDLKSILTSQPEENKEKKDS